MNIYLYKDGQKKENSEVFIPIGLVVALILVMLAVSGGCQISYYYQAAAGHFKIMNARVRIENLLQDSIDQELRNKLKLVQEIREFASNNLALPDNKSYTYYAELDQKYPGWNVFAAEKLSIQPKTWCYPIAGCVVYRGYFNQEKAIEEAKSLKEQGYDVYLSPFSGYSTLGIQQDPILSNHLKYDSIRLAGLIIHELAHQEFYYKKNSTVSESFAVSVEQSGVADWLTKVGSDEQILRAKSQWKAEQNRIRQVLDFRNELDSLYQTSLSNQEKLNQKKLLLDQFAKDHGLKRNLLNNAFFIPYGTYNDLVPEFMTLLDSCNQNYPLFFEQVKMKYK